jgi:hypothetical protein
MPLAKHLTGALIAYLEGASPWSAAIAGGVRSSQADRDRPTPYVVVEKVDESTLQVFGGRYLDTRTMLLSLYSTDRVEAETLGNQMRDLLLPTRDFTPPSLLFAEGIDGGRWRAGGDTIDLDEEHGPLGEDFWAYRLPINFRVSR